MTHPAHEHLLELNFMHDHVEAEWEDVGGPESGPKISGHPGYDQYGLDDMIVYIDIEGRAEYELWECGSLYPTSHSY